MIKDIRLICLIVGSIITIIPLRSQTFNIYATGTTWHYEYREGMDTPNIGYMKLEIVRDTVIKSKQCSILDKTRGFYNGEKTNLGSEILYFNQDEQKVYQVIDSIFFLLYNFRSVSKDTVNIPVLMDKSIIDTIFIVIDSVVNIENDQGGKLRAQYFHQIDESVYYLEEPIIENIGAWNYLLPINSLECDGGCPIKLRCFISETFSYESSGGKDCEYIYNLAPDNRSLRMPVQVYPNPVSNHLFVNTKIDRGSYKIINMMGQVILCNDFITSDFLIDCSEYKTGLFLIIIENNIREVVSREYFFVSQ